jgi:RNA polymerase sigma-70 factor (ECF subfamily)
MMRERSDEALMKAYAGGEMTAFEVLYQRHRGALYRYVVRLVGDEATANDLYQGTWEKIIRARRNYRPSAPFKAWMYRIAHNHVMDYFRRRRPVAELEADRLASNNPGPAESLQEERRGADLLQAVASLPDEQREAVLLKLEAGLDLETIAKVTGVKRETAKSRLRYAVKKLEKALGEADAEP